jgi:hypothetical protein
LNSAISASAPAMAVPTSSYCQAAATETATYSDLDSIFTPPASCLEPTFTLPPEGYDEASSDMYTETFSSADHTTTRIWEEYPSLARGRNPSCFPKNFPISTCDYATSLDGQIKYSRSEATYLYSPGICPEHYLVVESTVDSSRADLTRTLLSVVSLQHFRCHSTPNLTLFKGPRNRKLRG